MQRIILEDNIRYLEFTIVQDAKIDFWKREIENILENSYLNKDININFNTPNGEFTVITSIDKINYDFVFIKNNAAIPLASIIKITYNNDEKDSEDEKPNYYYTIMIIILVLLFILSIVLITIVQQQQSGLTADGRK